MKQFGKSHLILLVVLGGITLTTVFATGTIVPFTPPYQLNDTANNAVRLYVDNSGSVGIGTTNPANRLHVIGPTGGLTSLIAENNNGKYIEAGAGTSGSVVDFDNSGYLLIRGKPHAYEGLDAGSVEFARITGSGNVGIGTTNPQTKLDVASTSSNSIIRSETTTSGSSILDLLNNGNQEYQLVANRTSNHLEIWRPGNLPSPIMSMDPNSGNVGIGTTNPANRLHVIGPSGGFTSLITENNNGKYIEAGAGTSGSVVDFDNSGYLLIRGKPHAYEGLDAGSTEFVRVTGSGNVGIGTTSPMSALQVSAIGKRQITTSSGWLDLSSNAGGHGVVGFNMYTDAAGSTYNYSNTHGSIGAMGIILGTNNDWNSIGFVTSGTTSSIANQGFIPLERMTIKSGGNVGIGTTTPAQKLDVNGNIRVGGNLTSASTNEFKITAPSGVPICIGSGC